MNMEELSEMENSVKRLREHVPEENPKRLRTQMLGVGPTIGLRDAACARAEAAAMYAALTHDTGKTRRQQQAMATQIAARRTAVARASSKHAVAIHAQMTRVLSIHAIAAQAAARYAATCSMTTGTHVENTDTAQATAARAAAAQKTARRAIAACSAAVQATAAFTSAAHAAYEVARRTLADSPTVSPTGDDRYNAAGAADFSRISLHQQQRLQQHRRHGQPTRETVSTLLGYTVTIATQHVATQLSNTKSTAYKEMTQQHTS
ncbi:PREDICTED: uncharacterized protein LOC108358019 [Rhagoletis zephyria]|uniref:uncharacterized protein LOC108358019 n=1 Tax=Rhagoletis zephyria TaxID=28612 RepID=UPI000811823B|nr:PREDICTED: uncharacterized protein LOC108358019 [Rhagoletis zephyria]